MTPKYFAGAIAVATGGWPTVLLARMPVTTGHHLGGGSGVDISIGRIVVSLVICVIIAVLAVLLIRQRAGSSDLAALFARIDPGKRRIDIVETRRLSPHADVSLLRHRDREYLLVLQQGNVVVLREEAVAASDPTSTQCA